jgi:hypothetical protein
MTSVNPNAKRLPAYISIILEIRLTSLRTRDRMTA